MPRGTPMNWIDFPDDRLVVNGLAWWEETKPVLRRLPERMKDAIAPHLWKLAHDPSGGRVRFATDATALAVRVEFSDEPCLHNMSRVGNYGIDLWVDGEYWRPLFPKEGDTCMEEVLFADKPAARREIYIYMSVHAPLRIEAIGISESAEMWPPAPFALERPIVYYGTSITQGECSCRAGMTHPAVLARELNIDFINLGWSGAGRGEPKIAEAVAEVDACCYVMDYCQNHATAEALEAVYGQFLQIIRNRRPDTPIICITPIFSTGAIWAEPDIHIARREIISRAVAERERMGDEKITLVEGHDLLGEQDRDKLIDSTHPNTCGLVQMARRLAPTVRAVVGL